MSFRRRNVLRWALCLVPIAVLGFMYHVASQMPVRIRNMYAEWTATELIMTTHHLSGRLPTSWDDLAPWYERSNSGPRSQISFPQLRELVEIDFSQLPLIEASAKSGQPPPKFRALIRQKISGGGHWVHPDQMLADYFKSGEVIIMDEP